MYSRNNLYFFLQLPNTTNMLKKQTKKRKKTQKTHTATHLHINAHTHKTDTRSLLTIKCFKRSHSPFSFSFLTCTLGFLDSRIFGIEIFGIRDSRNFGIEMFGIAELSELRFTRFRDSWNFRIENFGIRNSGTLGFFGIFRIWRDPEKFPFPNFGIPKAKFSGKMPTLVHMPRDFLKQTLHCVCFYKFPVRDAKSLYKKTLLE